mmetsp:Transcript_4558/g.19408  ORF Transcript_4558/g.19408 Transcript_4558/m.19408 type:complete len:526 (+) Transcript_4558:292-1869(+)
MLLAVMALVRGRRWRCRWRTPWGCVFTRPLPRWRPRGGEASGACAVLQAPLARTPPPTTTTSRLVRLMGVATAPLPGGQPEAARALRTTAAPWCLACVRCLDAGGRGALRHAGRGVSRAARQGRCGGCFRPRGWLWTQRPTAARRQPAAPAIRLPKTGRAEPPLLLPPRQRARTTERASPRQSRTPPWPWRCFTGRRRASGAPSRPSWPWRCAWRWRSRAGRAPPRMMSKPAKPRGLARPSGPGRCPPARPARRRSPSPLRTARPRLTPRLATAPLPAGARALRSGKAAPGTPRRPTPQCAGPRSKTRTPAEPPWRRGPCSARWRPAHSPGQTCCSEPPRARRSFGRVRRRGCRRQGPTTRASRPMWLCRAESWGQSPSPTCSRRRCRCLRLCQGLTPAPAPLAAGSQGGLPKAPAESRRPCGRWRRPARRRCADGRRWRGRACGLRPRRRSRRSRPAGLGQPAAPPTASGGRCGGWWWLAWTCSNRRAWAEWSECGSKGFRPAWWTPVPPSSRLWAAMRAARGA